MPETLPTTPEMLNCELCDAQVVATRSGLCYDCRSTHERCNDCRAWVNEDDYTITADGDRVCESCLNDDYSSCIHCYEYYQCDDVIGGYCESCRDRLGMEQCSRCGEVTRDWESRGGEIVCESCDDAHDSRIHDYSYRPYPVFHGTGPLYYGVELEINAAEDTAESVYEAMGEDHVYLKRDSSIYSERYGDGYEIVTHPHDWHEITRLWRECWKAPARATSHMSGKCGMHVHVSRKALTNMHIQKMVVFVNAPENAAFIERIAQRNTERWAKLTPKEIGHVTRNSDRYEAINLQNSKTIEFRIFRGSIRTDRILKNLEFVSALIGWSKDCSYRDLTHTAFRSYVARYRKTYPHLADFIATNC